MVTKYSTNDLVESIEIDEFKAQNQQKQLKKSIKKLPLKGVKDFQDEFMDKYDEFSLSWRQAIDREKRF